MGNVSNPEQWAALERLRFIERSVWWRGWVKRQDVCGVYGVSAAQVSADFQKYLELNPGGVAYSLNRKRYEGRPEMTRVLEASTLEEAVALFLEGAGRLPVTGRQERSGNGRVEWLVLPERRAGEAVERAVFQAVLHGQKLEVLYASAHGKSRRWRWIQPHALAWSGKRWHARAWCLEKGTWQDFVLGRMEESRWPVAAEPLPVVDEDWERVVTLVVRPNAALDAEQRAAVAREYRMEKGRLEIPVREAMLIYLERALGLERGPGTEAGVSGGSWTEGEWLPRLERVSQ